MASKKAKSYAAKAAEDFMALVNGEHPEATLLGRTVEFRPITLAEIDLWPGDDNLEDMLKALTTMLNSRIDAEKDTIFHPEELREALDANTLNQLAVSLRTGRLPSRK